MRYLIKMAYDGSKYFGFQRLNNELTVQKELEQALTIINKSVVEVKGAGRTDRGVHAYGQYAHFDLEVAIPCDRLVSAINSLVSNYLRIEQCCSVFESFHARFNVQQKTYKYKINLGKYNPLLQNYVLQDVQGLDISKMEDASSVFIGIHNFELFTSGKREDYTAIIYDIKFNIHDDILEIEFVGKSFYRYMVRNIVGALIEVGKGKASKYLLSDMLMNPKNHNMLATALPQGLYLMDCSYDIIA